MTSTRARACAGKLAHGTRQDALAHLARLVRGGAAPWRLVIYRCRHCSRFHIGHRGRVSGDRRKA